MTKLFEDYLDELNQLEKDSKSQNQTNKNGLNKLIKSLNTNFEKYSISKYISEVTLQNPHLLENSFGRYVANPDPFGTMYRNRQRYFEKINEVRQEINDTLQILHEKTFLSYGEEGTKVNIFQLCEKPPIIVSHNLYDKIGNTGSIILIDNAKLLEEKDIQKTDLEKKAKLAQQIPILKEWIGKKTKTEYNSNKWAIVDEGCLVLKRKELLFFGEKRTIRDNDKTGINRIIIVDCQKNNLIIHRPGKEKNEMYFVNNAKIWCCLIEKLKKKTNP